MSDREPDDFATFAEMFEHGSSAGGARPPHDPVARARRRKRGRITALIIVGVLVAAVATYIPLALTAPVGAAAASTSRPDATPGAATKLTMPPEGETALSVSGADQYLGASASGVLASSGGDAAVPIASISKLITTLVILNAKPLTSATDAGPTITFSKADHALYDKYYVLNATIAAMPTGSAMSEHDTIETTLVVSACNYAEAMADWAFGSNAGFLSATKKWLAANGLTHTTMVEPTGIDAHNVSTPGDLITLGKLAMANPAVAAIVAKTSLDIPFLTGMANTNTLLGTDGVNGIKTGTLDGSGSDLLFSASVPVTGFPTLSIIGVMLGGASRESVNADVSNLITSLTAGFHEVPVATAGQVVGTYSTPWGAHAKMVIPVSATIPTYSDTKITSTMTTTTLKTGKNGEKVGSVTWTAGASTTTLPVVLDGAIAPPTAEWRLTHPFELWK
jgi:D-alanyl-D-alanine carboxypeptidase (penicillin-binding protein 5/6)